MPVPGVLPRSLPRRPSFSGPRAAQQHQAMLNSTSVSAGHCVAGHRVRVARKKPQPPLGPPHSLPRCRKKRRG